MYLYPFFGRRVDRGRGGWNLTSVGSWLRGNHGLDARAARGAWGVIGGVKGEVEVVCCGCAGGELLFERAAQGGFAQGSRAWGVGEVLLRLDLAGAMGEGSGGGDEDGEEEGGGGGGEGGG